MCFVLESQWIMQINLKRYQWHLIKYLKVIMQRQWTSSNKTAFQLLANTKFVHKFNNKPFKLWFVYGESDKAMKFLWNFFSFFYFTILSMERSECGIIDSDSYNSGFYIWLDYSVFIIDAFYCCHKNDSTNRNVPIDIRLLYWFVGFFSPRTFCHLAQFIHDSLINGCFSYKYSYKINNARLLFMWI